VPPLLLVPAGPLVVALPGPDGFVIGEELVDGIPGLGEAGLSGAVMLGFMGRAGVVPEADPEGVDGAVVLVCAQAATGTARSAALRVTLRNARAISAFRVILRLLFGCLAQDRVGHYRGNTACIWRLPRFRNAMSEPHVSRP
jgi:hypothetical protein